MEKLKVDYEQQVEQSEDEAERKLPVYQQVGTHMVELPNVHLSIWLHSPNAGPASSTTSMNSQIAQFIGLNTVIFTKRLCLVPPGPYQQIANRLREGNLELKQGVEALKEARPGALVCHPRQYACAYMVGWSMRHLSLWSY